MKIELSQHTPRNSERTIFIAKVSILTRKMSLQDIAKIYLNSNAIHVMRKDTFPEIFLEITRALTRRRKTKEYIMLTLHRKMNLPERESKKKVKILQVMKSMF